MGSRRTKRELEHASVTIEAREALERGNLVLPLKPKSDLPNVPKDVADLPDPDLMSLFAMLTRWASYLAGQLAMAEIDEEAAQTLVAKAEAMVMVGEGSSDARVTIRRAQREVDPEVSARREDHARARAYRTLLKVFYDNCERGSQLLSRELTRRTSLAPKERRADRYSA